MRLSRLSVAVLLLGWLAVLSMLAPACPRPSPAVPAAVELDWPDAAPMEPATVQTEEPAGAPAEATDPPAGSTGQD